MRRTLPFAAVLAIGLLIIGPAFAGVRCVMSAADAASACPMDMSNMGSDCPMPRMDVLACVSDCCAQQAPAVTAKHWVAEKAFTVAEMPVLTVTEKLVWDGIALRVPETNSPPVYVLNRVFRI
jgi:hypothetical protein